MSAEPLVDRTRGYVVALEQSLEPGGGWRASLVDPTGLICVSCVGNSARDAFDLMVHLLHERHSHAQHVIPSITGRWSA